MNKSDRLRAALKDSPAATAGSTDTSQDTVERGVPMIRISAVTGAGLDALRTRLSAAIGHTETTGGTFSARARHVEALQRARQQLAAAALQLQAKQGALAAFELRGAQASLGEVLGDVSSDELLGRIFGSFCIGK